MTSLTLHKPLAAPTPQLAQSMSPQRLDAHRKAIAFDVEVILDGYWDKRPPEDVKAGILADWCDALEDWSGEQVLFALRKWRDENENKKPNPSHILSMLKEIRGRAEVARAKKASVEPSPEREPLNEAQKAEANDMVRSFARRAGGAQ